MRGSSGISSRREFLKTSVAATCSVGLAGGALAQTLPAASPAVVSSARGASPRPDKLSLKKGVVFDMLPAKMSFADRCKLAKEVGVGGEFRKFPEFLSFFSLIPSSTCATFSLFFLHAIVIVIRLGRPEGLRSVVAESVLMRHQVLILNRGRKRAPNLRASDRIIAGLCTLMMRRARVLRSAIVLKPSTLLHFHKMLTKEKYRLLFSSKRVRRPGPKGPTKELIDAVVEMKRRNSAWGCKRIAQQIALAFGVDIDKDVVRRILGIQFRPEADSGGSVMAVFHWSRERLAMVIGFVSM